MDRRVDVGCAPQYTLVTLCPDGSDQDNLVNDFALVNCFFRWQRRKVGRLETQTILWGCLTTILHVFIFHLSCSSSSRNIQSLDISEGDINN